MDRLKLFVVGQKSAESAEWNGWFEYDIVIAHTAEEARSMVDANSAMPVTEIPLTSPQILASYKPAEWET
jgi:hypothetical protein